MPNEPAAPSDGGVPRRAKAFGEAIPKLPVSNIVHNSIIDILEFIDNNHSVFEEIAWVSLVNILAYFPLLEIIRKLYIIFEDYLILYN